MKKLHLITIIYCIHFFSVSPMHIIRRFDKLAKISTIKRPRFYSIPNNTNPKELRSLSHDKECNKNVLTSVFNLIGCGVTNNPLMLLPIVPQILHDRTMTKYKNHEKDQSQVQQDLIFFVKNNSTIIDDLKKINKITEEINNIRLDYESINHSKQWVDKDLTFYGRDLNANMHSLENKKTKLTNATLEKISPFFQLYNKINIPQCIEDTEKYRQQLRVLHTLSKCSKICSFPFAIIPLIWRRIRLWHNKPSEPYTPVGAIVLAAIILSQKFGPNPETIGEVLSLYASIGLSTKAADDNFIQSLNLIPEIEQQDADLGNVIDIFKLQQAHLEKNCKMHD